MYFTLLYSVFAEPDLVPLFSVCEDAEAGLHPLAGAGLEAVVDVRLEINGIKMRPFIIAH